MRQEPSEEGDAGQFSLVRDDPFYCLQRRIGLIPSQGGGFKRRAVIYALVAWLPLVIASWLGGAAVESAGIAEPLLGHIGIHVRCLVAIPLLVLAEGLAQGVIPLLMREFRRTGLIGRLQAPQFEQVLADMLRLRDRALPWVVIIGLVTTWTAAFLLAPNQDETQWASAESRSLAFGAWWFLLVTRPIFSVLLLAWVWRLILFGDGGGMGSQRVLPRCTGTFAVYTDDHLACDAGGHWAGADAGFFTDAIADQKTGVA